MDPNTNIATSFKTTFINSVDIYAKQNRHKDFECFLSLWKVYVLFAKYANNDPLMKPIALDAAIGSKFVQAK
jgi:hypothetical protein